MDHKHVKMADELALYDLKILWHIVHCPFLIIFPAPPLSPSFFFPH